MQTVLKSEMLKKCLVYENYMKKKNEILLSTFLKELLETCSRAGFSIPKSKYPILKSEK